jgi:hypothetical protein
MGLFEHQLDLGLDIASTHGEAGTGSGPPGTTSAAEQSLEKITETTRTATAENVAELYVLPPRRRAEFLAGLPVRP